jgi:hypothetical protein
MSRLFQFRAACVLIGLFACVLALVASSRLEAQDIQADLDELARTGGGTYRLSVPRMTVANGVVVPEGVTLDLAGGELIAILTDANSAGARMSSNSAVRNGTIRVVSRGSPGTQAGAHAAILIGALYGENASPDRLSAFEGVHDWVASDLTLISDKRVAVGGGLTLGAAAIQVVGGAHRGLIERVTVPDSDVLQGGILMDWGTVGAISSAHVADSAAAFRGGTGYTTHPYDIVVRDVIIGRLTRPSRNETGSYGVRLSGTRDIRVERVAIAETTEAAFRHTAGDLGFEFAKPADRGRALRGIVISGLTVEKAGAYLVRSDSYADNVGRAIIAGYRPAISPIGTTDIRISDVRGRSTRGGSGFGVRVDHQRGGEFVDISVHGFERGVFIDEQAYDLRLVRLVASESAIAAISVEHPSRPPARISIVDPRTMGSHARAREVIVGRSDDVSLTGTVSAVVRVVAGARRPKVPVGVAIRRD